jgi:hypothetical protein
MHAQDLEKINGFVGKSLEKISITSISSDFEAGYSLVFMAERGGAGKFWQLTVKLKSNYHQIT